MDLFNSQVVRDYGWVFLHGLAITTMLTMVVIVLASLLAVPLALVPRHRGFDSLGTPG
jgi:polar amino acid transport system permease protein